MVSMCAVLSLIGLAGPATSAVAVDGGRADAVAPADSGQDWTTWGYDVQRTGYNPNETTLSPTTVHGLHLLWSFPFPLKSDNAPVLATNVLVDGVPTNLIYAGDRTGTFHAVNADTGTEVWSRQLGTNVTCAGVLGVTDTAVIDRSTNLLYVAGGDGQLYALDLATGADAPGWPLDITMFPNEYVWSAITEFDGSLYVAVASGCDALGTNYGRVVRVDPDTLTQTAAFYVRMVRTRASGAGASGAGAASRSTRRTATPTRCPRTASRTAGTSTSCTRRASSGSTGDLSVVSSNYPGLRGRDVDFGSTPVLFDAPHGCGPQVAAEAKTGEVIVWDRDDIASGPVDRVRISSADLIGVPAWDPARQLLFVGNNADVAQRHLPRRTARVSRRPRLQAPPRLAASGRRRRHGPSGDRKRRRLLRKRNGAQAAGDRRQDPQEAVDVAAVVHELAADRADRRGRQGLRDDGPGPVRVRPLTPHGQRRPASG